MDAQEELQHILHNLSIIKADGEAKLREVGFPILVLVREVQASGIPGQQVQVIQIPVGTTQVGTGVLLQDGTIPVSATQEVVDSPVVDFLAEVVEVDSLVEVVATRAVVEEEDINSPIFTKSNLSL
jgi:hypothetical protein